MPQQQDRRTRLSYSYIRAWGEMMGSGQSYIREQVALAQGDKAPEDAIYWSRTPNQQVDVGPRVWARFSDITNMGTRAQMESILRRKHGITDPPQPNPQKMVEAAQRDVDYHLDALARARERLENWTRIKTESA